MWLGWSKTKATGIGNRLERKKLSIMASILDAMLFVDILGRNKVATFCRRYFPMHFLEWNGILIQDPVKKIP